MIVIFKNNANPEQVKQLCAGFEAQGLKIHNSEGEHTHLIGLIGDTSSVDIDLVRANDFVEDVKRVSEPYKKANRKFHPADTAVDVAGHTIGGGHFSVMAGPCSVESESQIVEVARDVQRSGAGILRGGAFKPRTSPYAFQGMRAEGLELLREARAATGRTPRVLAPFEYNFFLEDMKTLGTPARRLRSELGRIKKQWCALAPEDDWAVGEEKDVLELAHRLLGATNAMLEDEVAYLCGRYLQSDAGAGARQRFSLVLADDFQNLSVAQQTCLCLLARDQLIVAGNPDETVRVATSFPAPEGFATFDTLRRNVTVFALNTAFGNPNVTAFCDAVVRAGNEEALAADQREGTIRDIATVKWNTPDEEFNGLTRYLFAVNAENPEAAQSDLCIVAPNKQWAHAFEQMLVRRGFAVSSLGFERLAGDPRDTSHARALVAYTSLNLLADPDDLFAWRAWVGFGNYLTYSDGWHFLMDWCDEHDAGILDALEAAAAARTAGERTRCGTCFYYAGPRLRRKVTFFKNAVSILQAARSGEKCNF